MTKKRLMVAASLLAFVCLALGVLALLPPRPGVTKANFDRIQEKMTRDEVEQILGGPGMPFHGFAHHKPLRTWVWSGDDRSIAFVEIVDNSVISKKWEPSNETIAEMLRRWLRLPK